MENKIARLFEEQEINISEFARKTGIPYGTLYDIAKGKTAYERIGIGILIKIAHEFGMTADEILGEYEFDPKRYELLDIYDSLKAGGRKAIIASARGIYDAYIDEGFDEAHLDFDSI